MSKKPATAVSFGTPVKTGSIEVKSFGNREGSVIYKPLIEALKKLPEDKDLPVNVAPGLTAEQMQNRLNGPLRREITDAFAPKGFSLSRRTSADGKLILLRWTKKAPAAK